MTDRIRLGAICWLLTIEFFVAQFAAQAAWPTYSLQLEDISNLGLNACGAAAADGGPPLCSPLNLVFNGGMMLNGVLILLGVWLTRRLWPPGPLTTAALWLLAVGGGGGSLLVGLFPINVNPPLHMTGAVLALFVACFGIMLISAVSWQSARRFAVYSVATGLITLLAFVLYALELYLGLGRGVMERVAAWPHTVWYIVAGLLIWRGALRPSAS
jgi:hypothetical membrane protein